MKRSILSLALGAFAMALMLPLNANAQNFTRADGGTTSGPYVDLSASPVAVWRGGDEVSITHSAETTFLEGGGVACAGPTGAVTYTTDNSYWRLFDLAEFEIADDVNVTDVDMGLTVTLTPELTELDAVTQLKFYTVDGDFVQDNLTLIDSVEYVVTEEFNGVPTIVNIPVEGITIPGGSTFAFEWTTYSGNSEDTGLSGDYQIRFGQNAEGQTGSTYLSSPVGCGIVEPTPAEDLGAFGDLHWVLVVNGVTGTTANEDGAVAQRVALGQNFPNPVVSGATAIPFSLESAQDVNVAVFDALGREVAATTATFAAGEQSVQIDTSALPNGVYFYRVNAGETTQTRKMVVMQ